MRACERVLATLDRQQNIPQHLGFVLKTGVKSTPVLYLGRKLSARRPSTTGPSQYRRFTIVSSLSPGRWCWKPLLLVRLLPSVFP